MRKELANPEQTIARIAARQHGVVRLDQLEWAGLRPTAITRRVKAGRLHRLHRGVYAVGHTNLSREGRWLAAVFACGEGAVLSHESAAALWKLSPTCLPLAHVTVPGTNGRRKRPGIRLHYSTALTSKDVTRRNNIPVTTQARTLRDLGWGTERTRSDLERLFLRICRQHGIPKPEVNVRIGPYEVDFLWRAEAVGSRGRRLRLSLRSRDLSLGPGPRPGTGAPGPDGPPLRRRRDRPAISSCRRSGADASPRRRSSWRRVAVGVGVEIRHLGSLAIRGRLDDPVSMKAKLTAIVISLLAGASLATPAASAAPQCFGKPATIVGTNGNNTLNGTPGRDVIVAKAGNDTIQSKSNDDRVCLGDGDDFAGTSRGFDKIDGGEGKDEIHGGGKAGQPDPGDGDVIIGGPDDDFLDGTRGELDDRIRGGPGNDRIQGGEFADGGDGDDKIFSEGHVNDNHLDRIFGGEGDDRIQADLDGSPAVIHGGPDSDQLRGHNGDDRIFGESDDDELRGNGGADRLDGGNGNDFCNGAATATKVACET